VYNPRSAGGFVFAFAHPAEPAEDSGNIEQEIAKACFEPAKAFHFLSGIAFGYRLSIDAIASALGTDHNYLPRFVYSS